MSIPPLTEASQILLFALGEPRYALNLAVVERVVQAVEVIPLPKAPPFVLGVINVQGQVLPVVDIRPCFGLPLHEVNLTDQFILARTSSRRVALVAEGVNGIHHLAEGELVAAADLLSGTDYLQGVAKIDGQLVLICDLDQILSFDDELLLEASALRGAE